MGTRTRWSPRAVMIASSATTWGRLCLSASLTFSACRCASAAPLRCSPQSCRLRCTARRSPTPRPLPRQQRADVLEQLVGADRAVALLGHQPVDHLVDPLELLERINE